MDTTMSEVVQFIQENDVKFIRLAFCDIFGNQKNIAIMPTELERAFEQGIHFNAAALRGFLNVEASDLLLFPDPATLSVLPWRPAQGRVVRFYCDIRYPDGTPFEGDGRHLLREANRRARRAGYSLTMGTASEFYLFELDENGQPVCILSALPQLEESDPTPAPEENGTDNTNSGTKSDESSGENPASNAKDWSSSLWDDEEDSEKSELGDANAGEESAIPTEKVELDMTAASPEP